MDYKVEVGKKEFGKIKYETLPVIKYFLSEMGINVTQRPLKQSIQLSSGLTKKKIVLSSEEEGMPHSFRKTHLERNILKQIQKFLQACGAEVKLKNKKQDNEGNDLHLIFSLLEVPNIKEPLLELTPYSKSNHQKLIEVIQSDCENMMMRFKLNDRSVNYDPSILKIQIFSPVISNDEFWNRYGEAYAMTITSGIFARLLGSAPLSPFSLVPIENLLSLFTPDSKLEDLVQSTKNKDHSEQIERETAENKNQNKTKQAEVYFDYHLLVDETESQKVQLFGNLHIKNTGTEPLRNPVICLKSTSSDGIKITGQILPKNYAQTKGVLNQEGAKGWRYMNENWLEEFEEKGEIWICPIQEMEIKAQQTETLANLQIQLKDPEKQTVHVEAYVFINEEHLDFKSNNRISLSLLKKLESNREKKD